LLTLAFRNNRAAVRYALWFAASLKFLIPFALLVSLGSEIAWQKAPTSMQPRIPILMEQAAQSFAAPAFAGAAPPESHPRNDLPLAILAVWLCGFAVSVAYWVRGWQRVSKALSAATPLILDLSIPAMSCAEGMEPGVFGIWKPVLLLPAGIVDRLTPAQLDTIVAHELCHVERRDNLTSAIHMLAESIFWFHPLLWWLRARLVEERERACDEEVLHKASDPLTYAEGILNTCKFYASSPVVCVSDVTGANLKKRIAAILSPRALHSLGAARKLLLVSASLAAVVAPLAVGLLNAPAVRAQSTPASTLRFEVATIKLAKADEQGAGIKPSAGGERYEAIKVPLKLIISLMYKVPMHQISGGPSWIDSDFYDIEAKADHSYNIDDLHTMFQNLLVDRFQLKFHKETKEGPVYALVIDKSGSKMKVNESAQEFKWTISGNPAGGVIGTREPMDHFSWWLSTMVFRNERPVIDKTGLKGFYDFKLAFAPELPPGIDASKVPPGMMDNPPIFEALKEQLGLRLESQKGPVEYFVIDHVERPSAN
jgi:uncharacterized protein (TIGR03435 family)